MDAPPSFPKYFKKTTLFWLILPMLLFIGFIVYFEIELPPSLLALRGISHFNFSIWQAFTNTEQFWGDFYVNTVLGLILAGLFIYYSPRKQDSLNAVNEEDTLSNSIKASSIKRIKNSTFIFFLLLIIFLLIMLILGIIGVGFRNNLNLGEILHRIGNNRQFIWIIFVFVFLHQD